MYTLHILVDFAKIDLVYLEIKKCQGWEKHTYIYPHLGHLSFYESRVAIICLYLQIYDL